jgi:hypothetical protein
MGGLENCLRRFADRSEEPLAAGFFAIGDAAYHTNPLYGEVPARPSCTRISSANRWTRRPANRSPTARFLDQAAREEIEPSFALGRSRPRRVAKGRSEPARPLQRVLDSFFDDGVMPATRVDPSGTGLRPHDEHDGDPRSGLLQAGGRHARSRRLGARTRVRRRTEPTVPIASARSRRSRQPTR